MVNISQSLLQNDQFQEALPAGLSPLPFVPSQYPKDRLPEVIYLELDNPVRRLVEVLASQTSQACCLASEWVLTLFGPLGGVWTGESR